MKWDEFLAQFGSAPVILSEHLRSFAHKWKAPEVQISRWVRSGKLIQLKRGVYLLADLYRKTNHFEPFLAGLLKAPSYVSLEKALEWHGLIPESVPATISVTPKRPAVYNTPVGRFVYRNIQRDLFWGYEGHTLNGQVGFVARPEKALLDMVYLNNIHVTDDYLAELRLQNTGVISRKTLREFSVRFNKRIVIEAAGKIQKFLDALPKGGK